MSEFKFVITMSISIRIRLFIQKKISPGEDHGNGQTPAVCG